MIHRCYLDKDPQMCTLRGGSLSTAIKELGLVKEK